MRQVFLLGVILLMMASMVFAIIPSTEINGVLVKDYTLGKSSDCLTQIENTPVEQLSGIRAILLFKEHRLYNTVYHWGGVVFLYDCNEDKLKNALVHACQVKNGDNFYQNLKKDGSFYFCAAQIEHYNYFDNDMSVGSTMGGGVSVISPEVSIIPPVVERPVISIVDYNVYVPPVTN